MVLQALLTKATLLATKDHRQAVLEHFLARFLAWVLTTFTILQEWLLGWERFRSLVLHAFRRRYDALVQEATPPAAASPISFATLEYHVDTKSRQLLQFAGLHALSVQLTAQEALPPSQLLPCVSRVLLQTEEKDSGRYLEAVACALATSMHATLLPVDSALISRLAAVPFSAPPNALSHKTMLSLDSSSGLEELEHTTSSGVGGGGGGASLKSVSRTRLQLSWEALRRSVYARRAPTVLLLRRADRLLCSSMDAYEAFQEAWGSPELLALEAGGSSAPLVVVAACSIAETGAGVMEGRPSKGSSSRGGGEEKEEEGDEAEGDLAPKPSKGFFKGLFGGLGLGDDYGFEEDDMGLAALLKELEAPLEDKPNPRRVLPRLFPTRVKLQPPPSGPAALRHQQRMARDALEAAEEDNFRAARATAVSAGVSLPPKSSGLYSVSPPLTKADWGKALAWAVAMQLLQQERSNQQQQRRRQQQNGLQASQQEGLLDGGSGTTRRGATLQEEGLGAEGPGSGAMVVGIAEANGVHLEGGANIKESSQVTGEYGVRANGTSSGTAAAVVGAEAGQNGSTGDRQSIPANALPSRQASRARNSSSSSNGSYSNGSCQAAAGALLLHASRLLLPTSLLPLAVALLVGLESFVPAALQPAVASLAKAAGVLAARVAAPGSGLAGAGGKAGASGSSGTLGDDAVLDAVAAAAISEEQGGDIQLSPQAIRYGLGMVKRAGGAIKQGVRAADSYEKKLLDEVLSPEDCGAGFSEVGALAEAKRALREAVQLPLKHPHLFGGALARPSKGVLMFGPPGTGKTLLARAAAAECGASFLGINPSSVASKWFGDGVRFIRQVPPERQVSSLRLVMVTWWWAAFSLADKLSPCVIFVDEVDALLGKRNSLKEHEALREMKNEFMACWDGIRAGRAGRVMVLGATNRPFDIDEAVLRRFTDRVFVGLPNKAARRDILGVVLAGEALAPDVDVVRLAELTEGYSGSDLRQLCVQAALRPVRELLEREGKAAAAQQAKQAQHAEQQPTQQQAAAVQGGSGAGSENGEGEGGSGGGAAGKEFGEEPVETGGAGLVVVELDAVQQPEVHGSAEVSAAESEPGEGEALPYDAQQLGQLLEAAQGIAGEAGGPREELRPITMQDFEEAVREVTATVDPESSVIAELNEWNSRFGTIGSKRGVENKRLSYYL
ncbi:hypothetical protein N2152v2_008901 [Parachlorella kessleri]